MRNRYIVSLRENGAARPLRSAAGYGLGLLSVMLADGEAWSPSEEVVQGGMKQAPYLRTRIPAPIKATTYYRLSLSNMLYQLTDYIEQMTELWTSLTLCEDYLSITES